MSKRNKPRSSRASSGRVTSAVPNRVMEWVCEPCKFYVDVEPDADCPRCGTPFTERTSPRGSEPDAWFTVKVSVFECEACHKRFILEPDERCPRCGEPADGDEPAWTDRHATFGSALADLRSRWKAWTAAQPAFLSRGERLGPAEHLALMRSVMSKSSEFIDMAKGICQRTDWAADASAGVRSNLDALIGACDEAMDSVSGLAVQPPPLLLLSAHRQTARAIKSAVDAIVRMTLLHSAKYHSEAIEEMGRVQAALDTAAEMMAQVGTLLERADRVLLAPGFWAMGDEYETGRVAWEGVDANVATVTDAAEVVRRTFERVPGIVELPDEQAFLLLPAAAIGASFQDPERLISRAVAVRNLLDEADKSGDWVADPALLAERCWEGHRQLVDQVVRIGYAIRSDQPRKQLLHTALDVFAKFVEGPLRRLGGVAAVASKARRGEVFDQDTCDRYQPAETIQALKHAVPELLAGMDSLVRHAEAHYDYEYDDEGVTVRHLPPRGGRGRIVDHFTDEDLFEQLLNLNEALVAVELALLPYLWSFPNTVAHEVLERRSNTREAAFEILRALGGLKGWTDVAFAVFADVLQVTGTYRGPEDANPVIDLLPMVAAVWAALPEVMRVDVQLAGGEASLRRDQFLPQELNEGVRLHRTAALLADVRSQTDGGEDGAWEATALLLPAAVMPAHLVALVLAGEQEPGDAAQYLRWLVPQLRAALLDEPYAGLRDALVPALATTTRLLGAASVALAKGDRHFIRRCEQDLRQDLARLVDVRASAQAVLYSVA